MTRPSDSSSDDQSKNPAKQDEGAEKDWEDWGTDVNTRGRQGEVEEQ